MEEKKNLEKMLEFLNFLPVPKEDRRKKVGAYSDGENQQFADYIRGKLTLEDVKPIIKPSQNSITFDSETFLYPDEQYDEARRFLLLARLAGVYDTEHRLASMLKRCNADLPSAKRVDLAEYYIKYDLGIGTLLSDMSSVIHYRRYRVNTENFGIEDYAAYVDALYEKYGDDEFAHFEEGADNYFTKAYLYARNPDQYKAYGEEIAQYAATEPARGERDADQLKYEQLIFAFVHSPRNALMNQMLRDLLKHGGDQAHTWGVLADSHKDEDFVPAIQTLITDGFLTTKDAILHYAYKTEDARAVGDFFMANEALALEVAAENKDKYFMVMRPFWQCGKHLEQLRAIEDSFITNILSDEKVKGFEDYITGKTDVAPKSKKSPYSQYSNDMTCYNLYKVSEVPVRLFRFLLMNNLCKELKNIERLFYSRENQNEIWKMVETVAPEYRINYCVYWLNTSYVKFREEEQEKYADWLKGAEDAVTDLAVYERTFRIGDNPVKKYALDKIFTANPKYDPQILLECLGGTKPLQRLAVAYLGKNAEWRELVQPLLHSKKAAIADNAAQILAMYESVD